MDVALMTPVSEGRQGADSEKRPAEVRRSGPEPHFWEDIWINPLFQDIYQN